MPNRTIRGMRCAVTLLIAITGTRALAEPPATQPASVHVIADGPFKPNWDSLVAGYQCPDWFRDAKFGIWAHWNAQCEPEVGNWFARRMYVQGDPCYDYVVSHYGPPSKFGMMEVDNSWKAEHWEPDKLMALYKAAGAKYFFALASFHDNFDCFDSTYQEWNSVRVGPKKDIVGIWEKTARAAGLRFGVSNHSARAWSWFQTAYGYDAVGSLAGVRYDAFRLTKADGKGLWWDGLDPQDLYCGRNIVIPDGITSAAAMADWYKVHDGHGVTPPAAFAENWYLRCKDLIDKYHPDQLYFDDPGLPLGQNGLDIAAHFYNSNLAQNGGKMEGVLNAKRIPPEHAAGLVGDYERSIPDSILPNPWQTDTCIGNWIYNLSIFQRHRYKTVSTVVCMLLDVVSKNGNLMLSIPLKGDGTIDSDELAFLQGMAKWTDANGEGIFGSRPWKVFGESPPKPPITGPGYGESKLKYGEEDLRFTTKGGALFVYVLGKPTHAITVKSLATGTPLAKPVAIVTMLGSDTVVQWQQTDAGLIVQNPAMVPCDEAVGFKVTFKE